MTAANEASVTPITSAASIREQAGLPRFEASVIDPASDAGLANDAIRSGIGSRLMMVTGLGWHRWVGTHWESTTDAHALDVIREWGEHHAEEAMASAGSKDAIDIAERIAGAVGQRSSLRAALDLATGRLTVGPEDIDTDPLLLACANGVVNLHDETIRPARPEDRMTKCTRTAYKKSAKSPVWTGVLKALPDTDTRLYFQRLAGHAATGWPTNVVHFMQGGGSNGKSAIMDGLSAALGSYARQIPASLIAAGSVGRHPAEMAELHRVRLATLEELPEGRHLDIAVIKRITDTKKASARKMRQDFFEFALTHTLIGNTNYLPAVSETDNGAWRRLRMVPLPYTYVNGAPQGPHERKSAGDGMKRALATEKTREAVLAWIVEGAMAVIADNGELGDPSESVSSATANWRTEADDISAILRENVTTDETGFIPTTLLVDLVRRELSNRGAVAPKTTTAKARIREIAGFGPLDSDRITVGSGHWAVSARNPSEATAHRIKGKKLRGIKGFSFKPGVIGSEDDQF